ncbi:hypothetical protein M0805_002177 [Coniferiporia weirii]|nr:hypothetical protein M0805_002177 [Coniferiporia weirii]
MRVFSILSVAAAAALSLVPSAFAAPLVDAKAGAVAGAEVHARFVDAKAGAVAAAKVHARHVDAAAKAAAGAEVHARDTGCVSILTELKVNLGVHIDALGYLTSSNATAATIKPILSAVVSVIGDAVVQLKALDGCSDSTYDCACVLSEILIALCTVLGLVLSVVADVQILLGVIVDVALGNCLCELIGAVLALMDGLLVELVPLVLCIASTLLSLGLEVVGSLLTIC